MTINTKFLWSAIILLVFGLAFFAVKLYKPELLGVNNAYYGVYLESGDLYFGRLHYFPRLALSDTYLLVRNPNDQQNPFSLTRFADTFWKPADKIILNPQKILWLTRLENDSQVVNFIKNRGSQ